MSSYDRGSSSRSSSAKRDAFGRDLRPGTERRRRSYSRSRSRTRYSRSSDSESPSRNRGRRLNSTSHHYRRWPRNYQRRRRSRSRSRDRYYNNNNKYITQNRPQSKPKPIVHDVPKSFPSYKLFLLTLPNSITPEESQNLYIQKKNEYIQNIEMLYYTQHSSEEWFRYRYYDVKERNDQRTHQFNIMKELLYSNLDSKDIPCLSNPTDDKEGNVLFIHRIPPAMTIKQILSLFSSYNVADYYTSDASYFPPNYFNRFCWIVFRNDADAQKAFEEINHTKQSIGDGNTFDIFEINCSINKRKMGRPIPPLTEQELSFHLERLLNLCLMLDKLYKRESYINDILGEMQLTLVERVKVVDYYLRKIYYYSYFSGKSYEEYGQLLYSDGPFILFTDEPHESIEVTSQNDDDDGFATIDQAMNESDAFNKILETGYNMKITNIQKKQELLSKEITIDPQQIKIDFYNSHHKDTVMEEKICPTCTICSKMFSNRQYLMNHLVAKHTDNIETFKEQKKNDEMAILLYKNDLERYIPIPLELPDNNISIHNSLYNRYNNFRSNPSKNRDNILKEIHPKLQNLITYDI